MTEETNDYVDKYGDEVLDVDELSNTDIKINPDFYVHNAIVKAQNCLSDPNIKDGFVRYRLYVEQIELFAKSAKMTANNYTEELEKAISEIKETDPQVKQVLIANQKLQLLMGEIFSGKTLTAPLTLK